MTPAMPTLFIVFNPGSGRSARVRGMLEERLHAASLPYHLLHAPRSRDVATVSAKAVELARAQNGVVVAAGGDRTVNGVAQLVLPTQLRFGVLPLGTFNFFARANRIPLELDEAIRVLVQGHIRRMQVGLVNDRAFLVNASLGFYPMVLEDREQFKRRHGRTRWTALLSTLWSVLLRREPRLDLAIVNEGADRLVSASTLFIGNNRLQLERVGIDDAEAIGHGELTAVSVRAVGSWAMLGLLLRGAMARLGDSDRVEAFSFRRLTVSPLAGRRRAATVKVGIDGETVRMPAPLVFQVAPTRLYVVCPP
jgi:diacylglycerol kinase family enzyme